jgi:hypothetical protein
LATWKDKLLPQQQQLALAAAQYDLAADVQSLQDTAVQQVRATAAAQRAKAAAAEQARLEKERQLDGVQQAAVAAAVEKYKQAMSSQAVNSSDEAYVRLQHKVSAGTASDFCWLGTLIICSAALILTCAAQRKQRRKAVSLFLCAC